MISIHHLRNIILATWLCSAIACSEKKTQTTSEETHHEAEAEDIVSLTQAQIDAVQIEMGSPQQKNLAASLKVAGKLEVPAQNKALVTSLYRGIVRSIHVHPGSYIRKGQVVATIANTELSGVQQNFISISAQLKLAQLEYKRQQELVAGNAAPLKNLQKAQAELSSLQAQEAALRQQLLTLGISPSSVNSGNISSIIHVSAPISGTVSDIHTQIGSMVDPETPVAEIVNNSQLHLDLFVYEKDLSAIHLDQTIHFTLTNNPVKEYDAKVFSIGTAFANESKSVPVHAEVMGDKTGLIDGMNVTAVISLGSRIASAIPTEAIVTHAGKDYIFMQVAGSEIHHENEKGQDEVPGAVDSTMKHFRRVQVIRGASDLGYTEIQSVDTLPQQPTIVIKGAFFVMARMTNTEGHSH